MAICTGCNRSSEEVGGYDEDNPVESDGTYLNNLFVCTDCYIELVAIGQDIGQPLKIQKAARRLSRRETTELERKEKPS